MFFQTLFEVTGLPADTYRRNFLQRRLPACLRALGAKDLTSGVEKLRQKPEAASSVINAVLLGVTQFYRDEPVFRFLAGEIISGWKREARPLRVWSAACSEGHELYSVALLLAEAGLLAEAELLGTDFRSEAIMRAQAGRFCSESVLKFSDSRYHSYFTPDRAEVFIHAQLRTARWKQADLFDGAEPGPWDLILWRNMAIYLERKAAHDIWHSLVAELNPGGYLITGKADYPPSDLGLIRLATCIYQKSLPNKE